MKPEIVIDNESLRIVFATWGIESYRMFLRVKRLPEYQLARDDPSDTVTE